MSDIHIFTAQYVLPVSAPVVSPGAVAIGVGSGETVIVAVDTPEALRARFPAAGVRDFGEAAILPGLVNTHTHLELTALRGRLENLGFHEWIAALVRYKREQMTEADLLESARAGCREAMRAGVTTVADTAEAMTTLPAMIESGLRGVLYQECFGPAAEQATAALDGLQQKLETHRRTLDAAGATLRIRLGVSPHAPYSVSPIFYRRLAGYAQTEKLDMALHIAESAAETALLRDGTGPFADRLRNRGIAWTAPGCSPIAYLERLGVLDNAPLLIHCVAVEGEDITAIAASRSRVAHCPKSNAKLGHGIAPLDTMRYAGIHVGLGSDSVASNNTCDMLEEARFAGLAQRAAMRDARVLPPDDLLRLMTIDGARALGLDHLTGSLEPGRQADLIAIDLSAPHLRPHEDPVAAVTQSASGRDVIFTMAAGRVLYDAAAGVT
ncbi:MAG: amidohydrolase family protein [Blastocatellia bacterium]